MRDQKQWRDDLIASLLPYFADDPQPDLAAARLCEVELGLCLVEQLLPGHPAQAGWTLFGGYPFAAALGHAQTPAQQRMLRIGRHLLWPLRRRRMWTQSLDTYLTLPPELRGFHLAGKDDTPRRRSVSIAHHRWAIYAQALAAAPPYQTRSLPLAEPGAWRFLESRTWTSVELPKELPAEEATPHALGSSAAPDGKPLEAPWEELLATATWMEDQLRGPDDPDGGDWRHRLERVELCVRKPESGDFAPEHEVLRIDRMLHLLGMVGAGKSTLRDILAVWAATHDKRVTLVVGDVAEALHLVSLFTALGLKAAPVLGVTTREQHLQRTHRRLAAQDGGTSLLTHDALSLDYLSTACPLDALRGVEAAEPLAYRAAPCTQLFPPKRRPAQRPLTALATDGSQDTPAPNLRKRHGCPLWHRCPRHHGARELVAADIWVATPAALVHSAVPAHQNEERIRFLELACRRSDLIVVDEADRVQMQLDTMFAPAAVLTGRTPNSWLDEIHQHKIDELARGGRIQLSNSTVMEWTAALHTVTVAADRIYHMLLGHRSLRDWVEADYFSSWTLQFKLISDWFGKPSDADTDPADTPDQPAPEWDEDIGQAADGDEETQPPETRQPVTPDSSGDARRDAVVAVLDAFRDDPLGDREPGDPQVDSLVRLTRQLLHAIRPRNARRLVERELLSLAGDAVLESPDSVKEQVLRFEFTLLLSALHTRLDLLTELWPGVEAALNFGASSNVLSRRPPEDYRPLVPESPMGNILGFQFLSEDASLGQLRSGELRFFRCAGNGRELLLQLPELTIADGLPGPNVLLMSGTSWAGRSTRYHVLTEVGALLKPPPAERAAINETVFTTRFLTGPDGRPLKLSGTKPHLRPLVLEHMLDRLARRGTDGKPSVFEEELAAVNNERRERLLVLTGSYDEARRAADILNRIPRWAGKVCRLVADDADEEPAFYSSPAMGPDGGTVVALRRGDVANFASTGMEILVAPLLAVERGHNILDRGVAAIGSVFFLARPHPRPDDIGLAVQAVNDWAARLQRDGTFDEFVRAQPSLDKAGAQFRTLARARWRHLLNHPLAWSRLNEDEKISFTWDQLVVIWQVIGRLVRGGVPARVVFVDAPFATRAAAGKTVPDTWRTSLLLAMRHVLDPYLAPPPADETTPGAVPITALDRALVKALYEPLHTALAGIVPSAPDPTD
ncbi:signal recognition particle [Streptomyces scabiei]|uniref:pPIWI_RE_Z domain-containing protein n=1 Tax=Streptomyces scabiei TaxID=1930 RepID=UPI0029A9896D|nr:signal recognition particle [Streptomyces scabiei]MDX3112914.1 signal recognition particle [Streptomyces scabiei]